MQRLPWLGATSPGLKKDDSRLRLALLLFSLFLVQSHRLSWDKSASCHASTTNTTCKPYLYETNVVDMTNDVVKNGSFHYIYTFILNICYCRNHDSIPYCLNAWRLKTSIKRRRKTTSKQHLETEIPNSMLVVHTFLIQIAENTHINKKK